MWFSSVSKCILSLLWSALTPLSTASCGAGASAPSYSNTVTLTLVSSINLKCSRCLTSRLATSFSLSDMSSRWISACYVNELFNILISLLRAAIWSSYSCTKGPIVCPPSNYEKPSLAIISTAPSSFSSNPAPFTIWSTFAYSDAKSALFELNCF